MTLVGSSESVPDPHFNRISVVEYAGFDPALLEACAGRMPDGSPFFVDVPHPAPEGIRQVLALKQCHPTGESRSSMMLTGPDHAPSATEQLEISVAGPDTLDMFLELFLRGFATPEHLVPLATALFHDLVPQQCRPDNSRLYVGMYQGEPAATLYLFHERNEGGINMVSTREDLRARGLATAMMRRAMADARDLGVRLLSLETRWGGAPERLYQRLGFSTIGRHEVFTNVPDLKYGL
jgi:GNAT superfamily N-acetyltransferase